VATAAGDLRLRIPLRQAHSGSLLAIPLDNLLLQRGLIRSITVQQGDRSVEASYDQKVAQIAVDKLQGLACQILGQEFRVAGREAHLLVPVEASDRAITIITITLTPLAPLATTDASDLQELPTLTRGAA
jgi:hypothetical protein